ncbi:Txe/YoeB family addiction module toxin [Dyadobacter fanqingshengii]|uniref:Putative mRNA interferase YoeB n=1 Tax=Dyadobacter fanqingshengii TaxID=2906443 RepID=A0A9X1PFC1_9BACT|nr:Txe/YoeB family addiction module toxin [Dyadobacter fanqingshengii]MCF0043450.1 Txe/YoeB family addiction module toxin [Dyadobacter fanqingshengii]USJ35915.1 Txe/YoeB family addiction module toxin [Dyadobacter fanqingshengii]
MGPGNFKIKFTDLALHHLEFWHKSGQKAHIKRIERLIQSIRETPTSGIGKPELLRYNLAGKYSRRIDKEHRIIYKIEDQTVFIISMKGHYEP